MYGLGHAGKGELQEEGSAPAHDALEPDLATERFDHKFDQVQPQPRAVFLNIYGIVGAVKTAEYMWLIGFGNTNTVVAHGEYIAFVFAHEQNIHVTLER